MFTLRAIVHRHGMRNFLRPAHSWQVAPRTFTSLNSPLFKHVQMPSRPKPPPEEEIEESFLKGSGPGGQKINKTNSAVQLKHLPTGIVVKCQATRSRTENRKIARQLLANRLDNIEHGDESRASVVAAHKRKKKASSAKKRRRKYRKLGEEQATDEDMEGDEDGDEAGDEVDSSTSHDKVKAGEVTFIQA